MTEETKIKALAKHLEITEDEAQDLIESEDYLVLTDDEADEKMIEYVEDSLWTFNANFLASFLGCPIEAVQAIHDNGKCEDNNETFKQWLINCGIDISKFALVAASVDGRGHFLSLYDGEEIELNNNLFAYRMN